MLSKIKKIIPRPLLSVYHYVLAVLADFIYGSPSDKLIVIGVTGTTGKSSVVFLIAKILEKAGYKVGASSTFMFKIDKEEWLNDKKMTMVGRFALQNLIRRMVKANCQYAVIETTSQGIEQYRHLGINYDILVFTNLYPEHIEAHGSFENYKRAKFKLFQKLKDEHPKVIAGQKVKKTIIANLDNEHTKEVLDLWAEDKFAFTLANNSSDLARVIRAENIKPGSDGTIFQIEHQPFSVSLLGRHNVENLMPAIVVGLTQGLSLQSMASGLENLEGIPGRIERISEGQDFKVIIDYAYEPQAVKALYDVVGTIPHQRVLHVLGSCGGGRDVWRRPELGKIAGLMADVVVVTNEDPYDDNPSEIIDQVAAGAFSVGKVLNKNLFKLQDRREGIRKALKLASAGDLVLITGKGNEQAICVANGKRLPWDDRKVVKEELEKISGLTHKTE